MKTLRLFLLFMAITAFSLSTFSQTTSEKIINYTTKMMNKKIDRGECWDLVAFALNDAGATWQSPLGFGTKVDYLKAPLLAGDVMVFENSRFEKPSGEYMTFGQHYALVYEVKANNTIIIAHQNFNNVRKVALLEIDLSTLKKGKIEFYRPA